MPTYSGLYNTVYSDGQLTIGVGLPLDRVVDTREVSNNVRVRAAKHFIGRGDRIIARLIRTLVNGAVGDTATQTYRQVAAVQGFDIGMTSGGRRVINTINDVNRATVAADLTTLNLVTDYSSAPPSYPIDLSRNGGGGKVSGY